MSEESYRRRFQVTRKSKNETFRELAVTLAKKAGCCRRRSPSVETKLDAWQMIMCRRDGVDRGRTKEQTGEPRKCHKCGKPGHFARVCSEQKETSERLNSDKKESPRFEPKKVKCFNCGVLGIVVYWGFQVPRESCADQ